MGFLKPTLTLATLKAKFGVPNWVKQLKPSERPDFSFLNPDEFRQYVNIVSQDNALRFHQFLLENIISNKYKFSNAPATIKMKGSNVPWIDTRELIHHIEVVNDQVRMAKGKHKKAQISYEALAMILEYGVKDRGIPPRDVFRRSFADFKEKMITNVLDAF